MADDQKRKHVRLETDALVDYTGSEVLLFHKIENLSLGGLSICTPRVEELGTKVFITINFPDLNDMVEVEGEVVWVNEETPKDMGIKFLNLTDRDKDVLRRYIQERAKRTHPGA
jgi:uncharacterized protein (TIGR02266 family)